MKLQFKHQKFQADAAKAVVDVFTGQPYLTPSYMMDRGSGFYQQTLTEDEDFTGWSNQKIVPELNDRLILDQHVRFNGDAVAIVAGENEKPVDKALKLIKVKYEVLPHIRTRPKEIPVRKSSWQGIRMQSLPYHS